MDLCVNFRNDIEAFLSVPLSPPPFSVIPSVPADKTATFEPKTSLSMSSPVPVTLHEKHTALASHDTQRPAAVGHLPDQELTTAFESAIISTAIAAYSAPVGSGFSAITFNASKSIETFRAAYFKCNIDRTKAHCKFANCSQSYVMGANANRQKWDTHLFMSHKLSFARHREVQQALKRQNLDAQPLQDDTGRASSRLVQCSIAHYTSPHRLQELELEEDFELRLLQYTAAHSLPLAAVTSKSKSLRGLFDATYVLIKHRLESGSRHSSARISLPHTDRYTKDILGKRCDEMRTRLKSICTASMNMGFMPSITADGWKAKDNVHYVGVTMHTLTPGSRNTIVP